MKRDFDNSEKDHVRLKSYKRLREKDNKREKLLRQEKHMAGSDF